MTVQHVCVLASSIQVFTVHWQVHGVKCFVFLSFQYLSDKGSLYKQICLFNLLFPRLCYSQQVNHASNPESELVSGSSHVSKNHVITSATSAALLLHFILSTKCIPTITE